MQKVGRNDPCPCGSGKKFKKCCELKKHRKLSAEIVTAAPQSQQTRDTSKVSSLFFKRASAPKITEEPKQNS